MKKWKNHTKQNTFYDNNKKNIDYIFKKLDEFLKYHIEEQTNAGADVIQIFDSWAGSINETNINKLCYPKSVNAFWDNGIFLCNGVTYKSCEENYCIVIFY